MTAPAQGHLFVPATDGNQETDSDSWCTEPAVMDIVHAFWRDGIDLDPCSNRWAISLGWVRARTAWTKADDCMAQPTWPGRTCFLQPPYSREGAPIVEDWARRWDLGEMQETLALVKLDPSTDRWKQLDERSTSLVIFNRRLAHYIGGVRHDESNINSAMLLCTRLGPQARHRALEAAVDAAGLGGVYR